MTRGWAARGLRSSLFRPAPAADPAKGPRNDKLNLRIAPLPPPPTFPATSRDDPPGREAPAPRPYALPIGGAAEASIAIRHDRAKDADLLVEVIGARHSLGALDPPIGTFPRGPRVSWATVASGDLKLLHHPRSRLLVAASTAAVPRRGSRACSLREGSTRIYDPGHVVQRFGSELALARNARRDATLLLIGVDGLKQINSNHGRFAGDRALAFVAAQIDQLIRKEDVLARYEGDQFVLVVRGTERAQALELAEHIRSAVSVLCFGAGDERVVVTACVGVAMLSELTTTGAPLVALMALASARLHAANNGGRARVRARV